MVPRNGTKRENKGTLKCTKGDALKMQARSRIHAAITVAQAGIVGNPVTTAVAQA